MWLAENICDIRILDPGFTVHGTVISESTGSRFGEVRIHNSRNQGSKVWFGPSRGRVMMSELGTNWHEPMIGGGGRLHRERPRCAHPLRVKGCCDAKPNTEPTSGIDIRTRASFASLAVGRRPARSTFFPAGVANCLADTEALLGEPSRRGGHARVQEEGVRGER
jgi:hypothetical protein